MPLFVFVSGALSAPGTEYSKLWRCLLKPYLIVETLFLLFNMATVEEISSVYFIFPYWLLWYLPSLFCWRLMLNGIYRFNPLLVITISIAIALFAASLSFEGRLFSFLRILSYFPFFMLGYYLRADVRSLPVLPKGLKLICGVLFLIGCYAINQYLIDVDERLLWLADTFSKLQVDVMHGFML